MSVNLAFPHLIVIPEDDANREIANGFRLIVEKNARQFWLKKPASGWPKGKEELLVAFQVGAQRWEAVEVDPPKRRA